MNYGLLPDRFRPPEVAEYGGGQQVLGIWDEYAGVCWLRSGESGGIRWNWDRIRLGEALWVLRTEKGVLEGIGCRKMENRTLR